MPKESTCHSAGWLFLFTGVLGTIGLCLALYKIGACTVQDRACTARLGEAVEREANVPAAVWCR